MSFRAAFFFSAKICKAVQLIRKNIRAAADLLKPLSYFYYISVWKLLSSWYFCYWLRPSIHKMRIVIACKRSLLFWVFLFWYAKDVYLCISSDGTVILHCLSFLVFKGKMRPQAASNIFICFFISFASTYGDRLKLWINRINFRTSADCRKHKKYNF